MRVKQCGQKVVCRADGVEVAGEVQVDVFHGNNLRVSATRSAALDAKHGTQRRLAQRHHHVLAALGQRIGQANRRGGFALAGRRGVDGGNQDQFARLVLLVAQQVVVDLRLVLAVALKVLVVDARLLGDLLDRLRRARLRDLDVGQHG